MIKIEHTEVTGWETAIRGMRNPMNSWAKSDSCFGEIVFDSVEIGPNDHALMMNLAKAGPVHAKYRRMITVTCDITAPLYWWKETDCYRVGVEKNSCSTMHTIHKKLFEIDDFSHEHLERLEGLNTLIKLVDNLNFFREKYNKTGDEHYWWQMIQLLPASYNQRRTVLMNYEVLSNIYQYRRDHKLDEWRELCAWIEGLPYSEIITLNEAKNGE